MTDGILLAEIQRDRALRAYDTIIIDEAHERSLNIDFLLGYLKQLLPAPPGPQGHHHLGDDRPRAVRRHFGGRARSSRCRGRTYPVEVRYRPLGRGRDATTRRPRRGPATEHATRPRRSSTPSTSCAPRAPGDILVFLSGEREIRDTADALNAAAGAAATPRCCRCTPGSPRAEQHRVFQPHTGRRDRAGHQRRRDLADRAGHPLRHRPRHRADLPLLPAAPRCSGCRSSRSPRPRPTSGRAAAAGSPTASASGCTPRRTSTRGRSSPTRRSCAPTWPRSSCRWPRSASATSPVPVRRSARPAQRPRRRRSSSRSSARSTRPTDARSAHAARPPAGPAAGRPAAGRMVLEADTHGCVREVHGHRGRAVHPGPARAAGRPAAAQADQQHARFADRDSDFLA